MAALLVAFVLASVIGVPFIGLLLVRTRRELTDLRAELEARGVIGPAVGAAPRYGELEAGGAPGAVPRARVPVAPPVEEPRPPRAE